MWLNLALKYVLPPLVGIGLILGIYYKGKSVQKRTEAFQQMKLILERQNKLNVLTSHKNKLDYNLKVLRKVKPIDDERDSCILSEEIFSPKCEVYLK